MHVGGSLVDDGSGLSKSAVRCLGIAQLCAQATEGGVSFPGDQRRGIFAKLVECGVELPFSPMHIAPLDRNFRKEFMRTSDVLVRFVLCSGVK